MKLIDGLTQATFSKDEFVFREGEIGDKFFIIESGACECLKTTEHGAMESIRMLGEGSHFGEVAIINDSQRTLSVRAASDCRLLVLSREAFNRILGSIKHYLKEDYRKVHVMETVVEDDDEVIQEAQ